LDSGRGNIVPRGELRRTYAFCQHDLLTRTQGIIRPFRRRLRPGLHYALPTLSSRAEAYS
jgi:hypothetical protein